MIRMARALQILLPCLLALQVRASMADSGQGVQLVNLHTGERLVVRAQRLPAPSVLNRFLRCSIDQKYTFMDPRLVAAALKAAAELGAARVEIVSAFRTNRLNGVMHNESPNVALRSRHLNGQALDLRLTGVDTQTLCEYFQRMRLGGVGCYRGPRFVHIDVGPVRTW